MAQKWSILDQKWPNMAGLSTFQSGQKGPKGSKMANLSVFDHLGPFWVHLDPFGPFQTKMNFLPQMDKVGFGGGASEQKNQFLFEMVTKGPEGPKRVPNDQKHLG